jgi:4-hydroxy-tetrahydrodipicolinate reductase
MSFRIGIAGISGRMGQLLVEEVAAAGAVLSGGTRRSQPATSPVPLFADVAALAAASDVVIDFTRAGTAEAHAAALVTSGKPWVLGTSGLSAAEEAAVAEAAKTIPIVYAANFSAGVTLVLALAEEMGAALPAAQYDAEIVEMHHRQKVDAPSGTAIGMGRAVARGRGVDLQDVMQRAGRAYWPPADRGHRLRCPARRAGRGRAQPSLCRLRRANHSHASGFRPQDLCRGRRARGALGPGPCTYAL